MGTFDSQVRQLADENVAKGEGEHRKDREEDPVAPQPVLLWRLLITVGVTLRMGTSIEDLKVFTVLASQELLTLFPFDIAGRKSFIVNSTRLSLHFDP